jgi:PTH1 family peptidyl-tRNA hydrolase
MPTYLIAGLGNPGTEYAHTRHNVGFDAVDRFVARHGAAFSTERLADIARFRLKGRSILCIKPSTFMNLSGRALKYWVDRESVAREDVLVILDELSLPLSRMRLKARGSDGGHNGLKSIQESLGTQEYARLRFGIGNQYPRGGQVDFVLGRWTPEESPLVELKLSKCPDIIESFIFSGVDRTMTQFNNLEYTV